MKRFGSFHLRGVQKILSEESGSRHVTTIIIHAAHAHKAYVEDASHITLLRGLPATVCTFACYEL
jgi:hypothetical protein